MSADGILSIGQEACPCAFSLPVALNERCTCNYLHELHHLRQDGRTARKNQFHPSTKHLFCLVEDQTVVQGVRHRSRSVEVLQLRGKGPIDKQLFHTCFLLKFGIKQIVEAVEETRDAWKEVRPYQCQVHTYLLDVA